MLHDFETLNFVKEKFGPVRTIVIKNIKKLLKFRKINMLDDRHPSILNKFENLIDSYNIVKGDTWPKTLPTTNNELLALPPTIYNNIITTFNTDIHFEYLKFYVNDDALLDKLMPYSVNYKYNADNLLSPDTFLNSIRDLYTVFGLTDFKKVKHYILDYYKLWAAINLQQDCEVDNIPIIC